jgi:dTDP-4-amino-4,6-dideoxygalactose transaminase
VAAYERFAIGFDARDRARLHELWDGVIDSNRWSEGELTAGFEAAWAQHNGLGAVAMASWTGGALAALEWAGVRGRNVVVPSNTFAATPLAVLAAGGTPVFGDCRRDDLCLSLDEVQRLVDRHDPAAVFLVHIGGHIAFEAPAIAALCGERGITLLEDCAHAHGAVWDGRRPGTFGDAGIYSLYATKTISTGEGGVLVSRHDELLDFARAYRNYAKPDHAQPGLNFRMSEFTAALGLVQIERLDEIVAWKNEIARRELDPRYPARLELPDGMVSGLYKYIVFDWLDRSTGRVYDQPCHRIFATGDELPNSDWVAANHSCVPLYYRPGE